LLLAFLSGCAAQKDPSPQPAYITYEGQEPDKWVSAWLIESFISPGSHVAFQEPGSPLEMGVAFDTPKAEFRRTRDSTTYQSLLAGSEIQDPVLVRIGQIFNSLESSRWDSMGDPIVDVVEQGYRTLQGSAGGQLKATICPNRFFYALYEAFRNGPVDAAELQKSLSMVADCQMSLAAVEKSSTPNKVSLVPIADILNMMAMGKRVAFVDAREAAEYDETHIPGAINYSLRQVTPGLRKRLDDADLVIAYCIKDFRGYEVARAIAEAGVSNVATMMPYGLAGWKSMGLPITKPGKSDVVAKAELLRCARGGDTCRRM
jgi:rhodanese-related sulfurtransferase